MPDHSILSRLLERLTRGVLRARRTVLVVCVLSAILSVVVAFQWLGFRTSRLDLLNPQSDYNRRWLDYLAEFGGDDDILVIVAGADTDSITPPLEALAAELERQPDMFQHVLARSDLERLRPKGLHFIPESDLRKLAAYVEHLEPLAQGDSRRLSMSAGLTRALGGGQAGDPRAREAALAWLQSLLDALDGRSSAAPIGAELERLTERFAEFRSRPLIDGGGRLGLCAVRFTNQEQQLVPNAAPIARLRSVVAEIRTRYPEVRIGVTGMPILEFDEMQSSQWDMTVASILSLIGVVILLVLGYGSFRYALLAVGVLLFGMAWTFGFVTLVIGHLNLLSVSFAVILIGLGIDFGIHYLARFCQLRSEGAPSAGALIETTRSIGRGVVTGAVTTACAFFAAGLTDFTGVAELGIIAGGGILICLVAALVVLPPLVFTIDQRWPVRMTGAALGLEPVLSRIGRRTWLLVAGTVLLAVAAAPGVWRLRYDHNLLNLQPKHIESVEWEHVLLTQSDRSVWFAVSMADSPAELRRLKARFESLPSVERTEEIVSLQPESSSESQALIRRLSERLTRLPSRVPLLPAMTAADLQGDLQRAGPELAAGLQADSELGRVWGEIQSRLTRLGPGEGSRRLSVWRQRAAESAWARLQALAEFTDPVAPRVEDLDASLAHRFRGKNGRHLLRVYARGSVWDMDALERFVRDVERVDPRVTGHPIQTYYASGQMQRTYLHAAAYAFLAVMIVLMLDFQSLSLSLLACLPLLLGFWLMLGVLGWLDIPLNAANMIVLPLVLGIGIDNGVHVVHDWRSQPRGRYRLRPSVGVAMLLCSSTTMVGFCSMIFAKHQGLRTLGQVLTLGIACCLATSLGFLPALLEGWDRFRKPVGGAEGERPSDSADRLAA